MNTFTLFHPVGISRQLASPLQPPDFRIRRMIARGRIAFASVAVIIVTIFFGQLANAQERRSILYERPVAGGPTYGELAEKFYAAYVFPVECTYQGFGARRQTCVAEVIETNDRGGYWVTMRAKYRVVLANLPVPAAETARVYYENGNVRVDWTKGLKGFINTRSAGRWIQDAFTIEPPPALPDAASAIARKYSDLGGPQSFLGQVTSPETSCADNTGRYMHVQSGSIFWSPQTGAYEVHGYICQKWAALGYERSFLGYPLTDELPTADGIGRYSKFQGGYIVWSQKTGAHPIKGDVFKKWMQFGAGKGLLGYPVSDEIRNPDQVGIRQVFQNGVIYFSPTTGAREVHGEILREYLRIGATSSRLGYPVSDEMDNYLGANGRLSNFWQGYITWNPQNGTQVHYPN